MVNSTSRTVVRRSTRDAAAGASGPCSRCIARENCEIAGEWLNANTSTGMISHTDSVNSPADGTTARSPTCQVGTR